MSKQAGIRAIKSAASAGASELRRKGLHKAARGLAVVGGATASIGGHVEGWHGELGGMMRGAPLGRRRKKRRTKARKGHTRRKVHHRKKHHKSRKHRSPAQRAATRKMLAANRRKRGHRRSRRKR